MKTQKVLVLSILVTILAFTVNVAFGSHDSEESIEEIRAGCREDSILVFRLVNHAYLCTSPSTAASWVKLGLAEIIQGQTESKDTMKTSEQLIEIKDENKENITDSNKLSGVVNKKNIVLPPYPEQPSINPELLATNDYRYPPNIHKINERIWVAVGYDVANSVMIEGDKGIIIIDTLSNYESAKMVINEFRKITDKPVKTIIYTTSNLEQVGGTRAFLEEGDDDVEIISHKNHLSHYVHQNILLEQITLLRSQYATGSFLPNEGPDKNNLGGISKNTVSTIAYVPPTDTFSNKFDLNISNVKMTLVHIGDESSDQIYVWLQDDKSIVLGDNTYGSFPNTYVLRGGTYYDPMNYVEILDKIISIEPNSLILSHVKPVVGKENVKNILILTRDATQYVHDQTIRGINNGHTADELANMIKLPPSLENNSWLTYQKGQIPWIVKQIYHGTTGWIDDDFIFLQPPSQDKRSSKIINGFGGVEKALLEIRKAIETKEYGWGIELATYVLHVDPENTEAKLLKAQALRIVSQNTLSFEARHMALTNALELEEKIAINSDDFSQMSYDHLVEIPIKKLLYVLPTKLKSDIGDVRAGMTIYYPDIDKGFTLQFRNNILIVTEDSDNMDGYHIIMDTKTHKAIMSGDLKLIDAINSKQIELKGNQNNILYLMSLIHGGSEGIPTKFIT